MRSRVSPALMRAMENSSRPGPSPESLSAAERRAAGAEDLDLATEGDLAAAALGAEAVLRTAPSLAPAFWVADLLLAAGASALAEGALADLADLVSAEEAV